MKTKTQNLLIVAKFNRYVNVLVFLGRFHARLDRAYRHRNETMQTLWQMRHLFGDLFTLASEFLGGRGNGRSS